MKKFLVLVLTLNFLFTPKVFAVNESVYSMSLSRMEREWLNKEYPSDTDEVRLDRLEEKVFGTIFENDIKSRYVNLRKAFDAKKQMQNKRSWFEQNIVGMPTSVPIRAENLLYGRY